MTKTPTAKARKVKPVKAWGLVGSKKKILLGFIYATRAQAREDRNVFALFKARIIRVLITPLSK